MTARRQEPAAVIKRSHHNGCHALAAVRRGDRADPWCPSPKGGVFADSLGRRSRHGYTYWIALRCNDPGCPAVKWVRGAAVTQIGEPTPSHNREALR